MRVSLRVSIKVTLRILHGLLRLRALGLGISSFGLGSRVQV